MKTSFWYIIFACALFGCEDEEVPFLSYEEVNPTVGPEGGVVNFYESHLPGETGSNNPDAVVTIEIPAGALDDSITFRVRRREIGSSSFETWEILPNDLVFNTPVRLSMTYGMDQTDYNIKPDICFHKPMSIPINESIISALQDEDTWQTLTDYQLHEEDLRFEIEINDLKDIYFFGVKNNNADYTFCGTSNNHVDIPLGGEHNVLIIPPGAVLPNTSLTINYLSLPEKEDYPQPTIDNYVILNPAYSYRSIEANNIALQVKAMQFMQAKTAQSGEASLDWEQVNSAVKILRIDPTTFTILETLDYDQSLTNLDEHLFATQIDTIGTYVLGIPKADFKLRLGGQIHVVASGGTTYDEIIEQSDFGGAFIGFISARYHLNINSGKDESAGYFSLFIAQGDDFNDQEYPKFTEDKFIFQYYDSSDTLRWVKFEYKGANLTYSNIDIDGGWIEGNLKGKTAASAYNESDEEVDLEIAFKFKIAQ